LDNDGYVTKNDTDMIAEYRERLKREQVK